jgi:hypothetical protein
MSQHMTATHLANANACFLVIDKKESPGYNVIVICRTSSSAFLQIESAGYDGHDTLYCYHRDTGELLSGLRGLAPREPFSARRPFAEQYAVLHLQAIGQNKEAGIS